MKVERETLNLLSIDVDDLLVANADLCRSLVPSDYISNLEFEVDRTLDLLEECQSKATFFVNAQYCNQYASTIREIVSRGHVIASHGFHHGNIAELSLEGFKADLQRSLEALSAFQTNIIGYRPPAFTMPYVSEYFELLTASGIKYVSSGAGYSRSNVPHVNSPKALTASLQHIPISTHYMGKIKYPVGYGVVARLLPERLYLKTLEMWLEKHDFFHFYFHPFEVPGAKIQIPDSFSTSVAISTWIYALRCDNRRSLF